MVRNADKPGSRLSKMDERREVRVRERGREKRHKETKREGESSLTERPRRVNYSWGIRKEGRLKSHRQV